MSKIHRKGIAAAFPGAFLRPRNLAMPFEHVESAIVIFVRFGHKTKGMITTPFLSLFLESVDD